MLGLGAFLAAMGACQPGPSEPVRVTVVVVLASPKCQTVDPRLVELAKAVQKTDPTLTGFTLHASEAKSALPGATVTFDLIDRQKLEVKVQRPPDENDRVMLLIHPPGLKEVSYSCACDRFFPVVTPHRTAAGETLILAIMARPCAMKK